MSEAETLPPEGPSDLAEASNFALIKGVASVFTFQSASFFAFADMLIVGLGEQRLRFGTPTDAVPLLAATAAMAWASYRSWLVTTRRVCLLIGPERYLRADKERLEFHLPVVAEHGWETPFSEGAHLDFRVPYAERSLPWSDIVAAEFHDKRDWYGSPVRSWIVLHLADGERLALDTRDFKDKPEELWERFQEASQGLPEKPPSKAEQLLAGKPEEVRAAAVPDGVLLPRARPRLSPQVTLAVAIGWWLTAFFGLGVLLANVPGLDFATAIFWGHPADLGAGLFLLSFVFLVALLLRLRRAWGLPPRIAWDADGLELRGPGLGPVFLPWSTIEELDVRKDDDQVTLEVRAEGVEWSLDLEDFHEAPQVILSPLTTCWTTRRGHPPPPSRVLPPEEPSAPQLVPGVEFGPDRRAWLLSLHRLGVAMLLGTGAVFFLGYLRLFGRVISMSPFDYLPSRLLALFLVALAGSSLAFAVAHLRHAERPRSALAWGPEGIQCHHSSVEPADSLGWTLVFCPPLPQVWRIPWERVSDVALETRPRDGGGHFRRILLMGEGGGALAIDPVDYDGSTSELWRRLAGLRRRHSKPEDWKEERTHASEEERAEFARTFASSGMSGGALRMLGVGLFGLLIVGGSISQFFPAIFGYAQYSVSSSYTFRLPTVRADWIKPPLLSNLAFWHGTYEGTRFTIRGAVESVDANQLVYHTPKLDVRGPASLVVRLGPDPWKLGKRPRRGQMFNIYAVYESVDEANGVIVFKEGTVTP